MAYRQSWSKEDLLSASKKITEDFANKRRSVCERPRTCQPVWRDSKHEGERELRPWREHNTFEDREHNARMRALEELERVTRGPGKRNGAAGQVALEVYRFLLRLRCRASGRLEPSYAWLAAQLNRSRSAVADALARLKALKFLSWHRRTRPIEDPEPGGQYVQQISNAYILELQGKAAELVDRMLRRPSEPVRAVLLARDRERRHKEAARLSTDELLDQVKDPTLRRLLTGLRDMVVRASPPEPMRGAVPE